MAAVKWIETTREVYFAIYNQHVSSFLLHATISHIDHPDFGYHLMTEWGLPGADFPLIKIDTRDAERKTQRYFLAAVIRSSGDEGGK